MGIVLEIFTIFSLAVGGIHGAENALGPGNGVAKKLAVVNPVLDAVNAIATKMGLTVDNTAATHAVGGIVDGVVGLFNLLGVFKHKT